MLLYYNIYCAAIVYNNNNINNFKTLGMKYQGTKNNNSNNWHFTPLGKNKNKNTQINNNNSNS